jgi:hypothetical protein
MTAVRVLETNVLHASDVIFWLDGTSAEDTADMLRVPDVLDLTLTDKPNDLRVVHSAGKTALLRRPTNEMINGVASDADKQRPTEPTYTLAGIVNDTTGRYVPRCFSIDAGNAAGHALVVYPTPLGTRFGSAGGLLGTLRFDGSQTTVPWALLTLTVTTALGATLIFRCQANSNGDFMLPMHRLPHLPEGISSYTATLGINALEGADAETPLDPDDLVAMRLCSLDTDNSFSDSIGLAVIPGEIRLVRSSNRKHLAVQPK